MKFEKSRLEPLKIDIGGTIYPVRITFGGMAELEEMLGMPFLEAFNLFISNTFGVKEVKTILYVMLKGGGVELTPDDLDDVDFTTDIIDVISDALLRANKVVSELAEQQEPSGQGDGSTKKKKTA